MYRATQPILASLAAVTFAALLASSLASQQFSNGSFENWGPNTSCGINQAPDSWVHYNGGFTPGVDEGNFVACRHTIPADAHDGVTYVRSYAILNGGEGVQQVVSGFVPGLSYTLRYHYAGSNKWGGTADGFWRVTLDAAAIDNTPTYSSLQTSWTQREVTFTATATSHAIGFRGFREPSASGSASLGLDNVSMAQLADASPYGSPCSVGSVLGLTSNAPALGSTWTLQGSGIEAVSSLAVFWFGDSALLSPLDLSGFGAAGCFAHTNGNIGAFSAPASGGSASYSVAVPSVPVLIGSQLFVQMSAASTATTVGFTTSNGLAGTIGG